MTEVLAFIGGYTLGIISLAWLLGEDKDTTTKVKGLDNKPNCYKNVKSHQEIAENDCFTCKHENTCLENMYKEAERRRK